MGYFQLGPQLAFRARTELNYGKADLDYGAADETIDVKDLFRKVNFGVVLGCGIAFNLPGNVVISTGMRADLGLTDAVNQDSEWSFLLSVDENGDRKPTYNFTGGAEVAVKYVLKKDRKKTKVIVY
jgi:hypothetical protein